MATKTISITQEAYDRLKMRKENNESFSEVINRITNKVNILDFAGILSNEEANILEKNIKNSRLRSRMRLDKIRGMLK
ncbi:antitoxin VapB family protein [Candidatus Woesearchaeota archaeon]|nr:antitoxin VapB family protein [Candidatus Woesearchaeota archaeon]